MKTETQRVKKKKSDAILLVFSKAQDFEESANIAVDEILAVLYSLKLGNALSDAIEYYEEVKHELNKSE